MYGAILGDMIGSPYDFDRGNKTKEFPLFSRGSRYTDDSVMTIAVAEALMDNMGKSDGEVKSALVISMQKWANKYPSAGYGRMFCIWLGEKNPKPYGSFGNGSAMRVSAAGWLYDTIEETRKYARLTAEVSHNHPEGIKGAEAAASAIFMARHGSTKEEIKDYIIREFAYDLSRTCDEIRPTYHHVETCQQTVPEAITAFLEGEDFEDVIRTAVSLGGDCDTLTCIAGGIAEAFYGVPDSDKLECRGRLPEDMLAVLERFDEVKQKKNIMLTFSSMIRVVIDLSEEQIGQIYESLAAFDRNFIGYRLKGSVNIGIESDGELIAGLNGYMTAFKIFYIDTVFVEEEYRRQGVGTELLKEAEKRAKALGANMIRLDTFNWQGREFYKKLGYEEVGQYASPEDGFSEHFFVKRLNS